MDVLTELVAKISTDASGLKSGLASADKSIGSFVTKNQAGLRALGVAFTALGAAIVGGLGASTKAAIDFETAFTGVRKTVEGTDAEFATLRQGIRDLAKVLPLPAVEIAGIAQAAGQLGIKTKDIMKFTEVIAKLGMATDLTSQDAAVLLAKFTNVMRMDISNMDRLAASIVDLGNNMATNEPEIVAMASRLTGAAAVVGMTEANVIALAAALSSLGVEAQMGGTAVQRVLLEMNTAVISGGKELKGFADIAGVTTSEFARAFKDDAASALITFVTGLKSAMDSGQDVTSMLKDLGLADMRVLQVLLKSAGGLDRLTEAQLISNKAWEEKIALDVEVAKRLEDTKAKMDIMKNVLIDLGITIGDFIIPLLKQFVDWLMPIIENVKIWVDENDELAKKIVIVAGVVGGLLLVLGPLLIMLPGIVTALGLVKLAWIGLTASMTVNPIFLVILAITLLVAEIVWLMNNMDKMIHFWDDVFSNMKIIALSAVDFILETLENLIGWIPGLGDKIGQFRNDLANMIRVEKIVKDARDVRDALEDVSEALEETTEIVELNTDATVEQTEAAYENIKVLKAQQDELLELTGRIRSMRREYEYTRSDAGKLGISIRDVTFALFDQGKSVEEVADKMSLLGDDANDVNKVLEAFGLTAQEVNNILEAQKKNIDNVTDAYNKQAIAAVEAAKAAKTGAISPEFGHGGIEPGMSPEQIAYAKGYDWDTLNPEQYEEVVSEAGSPKGYATGGIVSGPIGQPQLATVHGGETIIPANESMGGVTINFTQPVFFDREDNMNRFVDMISKGLDRKYRLSGRSLS